VPPGRHTDLSVPLAGAAPPPSLGVAAPLAEAFRGAGDS